MVYLAHRIAVAAHLVLVSEDLTHSVYHAAEMVMEAAVAQGYLAV